MRFDFILNSRFRHIITQRKTDFKWKIMILYLLVAYSRCNFLLWMNYLHKMCNVKCCSWGNVVLQHIFSHLTKIQIVISSSCHMLKKKVFFSFFYNRIWRTKIYSNIFTISGKILTKKKPRPYYYSKDKLPVVKKLLWQLFLLRFLPTWQVSLQMMDDEPVFYW